MRGSQFVLSRAAIAAGWRIQVDAFAKDDIRSDCADRPRVSEVVDAGLGCEREVRSGRKRQWIKVGQTMSYRGPNFLSRWWAKPSTGYFRKMKPDEGVSSADAKIKFIFVT